ncbi:hypothetical protein K438DRAFT_1853104 [Mycena galopus ATCC 62051]|nr:hypothetical protein K438DRAFT_1853104 [Mycena galopus ATCC 62051]
MALVVSALTLGYAAFIVAHDRHSTIGIAHLTVSTVSLVMGAGTCVGTCTLRNRDLRAPLALAFMFVNLLMYVGVVVPLAIDPIAHRDIRAGEHLGGDFGAAAVAHPYYSLFVMDLVLICKTAFGFIVLCISCSCG